MNDRSKLPAWARNLIEKLEADIAYERKRNAVIDAGESDTWIESNVPTFGAKTFLPSGSLIKFRTKGGIVRVNAIRDRRDRQVGELDVNSEVGALIVRPRAANALFLYAET